MQEVKIKFEGKEYTLNNNSGKYSRIFQPNFGGENPTDEEILAYYDSFAGLILDENGSKVESGKFWKKYQIKLAKEQKRRESLAIFGKITSHPVIASLIVITVLAILWYIFGVDLRSFS